MAYIKTLAEAKWFPHHAYVHSILWQYNRMLMPLITTWWKLRFPALSKCWMPIVSHEIVYNLIPLALIVPPVISCYTDSLSRHLCMYVCPAQRSMTKLDMKMMMKMNIDKEMGVPKVKKQGTV